MILLCSLLCVFTLNYGFLFAYSDKKPSKFFSVVAKPLSASKSIIENGGDGSTLKDIAIYDTTLRDGTQMEGISVSVDDKLKIARALSTFGMNYIEGGWPGSNPKDKEFFERAKRELSEETWNKIVAFGSTRRKFTKCENDQQLKLLIEADTNCITIVAKAWDLHVDKILEVPREENLAMVEESISFLKSYNKEVMIDLEHHFDGFFSNPSYTLEVCERAVKGGADVLVLCDTNGGSLPWQIDEAVKAVRERLPNVRIGIHCHNDQELAVCNSLQAVKSGATVVQGTVNGIGERTGNANLISIIPTLQLKMGCVGVRENLKNLTELSRYVDEQLNRLPDSKAPYVGQSAFAHKGGIHVSAVNKIPDSYQHIDPQSVGNARRTLVSELSGRSNILSKIEEFGIGSKDEYSSPAWKERMSRVLEAVKGLEKRGYTFEGADATVNLMIRRLMPGYSEPFLLLDYTATTADTFTAHEANQSNIASSWARATVKVRLPLGLNDQSKRMFEDEDPFVWLESAEGNGPVNALAKALSKALLPTFPSLQNVVLQDYKVRILDQEKATAANTRVMIEFHDLKHNEHWATVGVNTNIISASMSALMDGFEFALVQYAPACSLKIKSADHSKILA